MRAILAQIHYDRIRDSCDRARGRQVVAHGSSKAILPLENGETFLRASCAHFATQAVDDVVVVVGHEAEAIGTLPDWRRRAIRGERRLRYRRPVFVAARGSIAVDRPGVIAALVTLVDVPFVSAATVRAVLDRYHQTHAPIVRPSGARSTVIRC